MSSLQELTFELVDGKGILPQRGTAESSGLDFFAPEDFEIRPWKDGLLDLKIKVDLPKGYDLVLHNKSGISTKRHLFVGAHVVDSDYTGSIHLHLFNFSNFAVTFKKGEKVVQGIIRRVELWTPVVGKVLKETDRGAGGFGSTGV